ncbi:putative Xaa-Pro aminopeptidase P [Cucumispora dikerogammari]|nr:putative Xaa-Pro aminopeptidase P [Cucumispora dikerogammari]
MDRILEKLNIDTMIIPLETEHLEEYPAVFDHILSKIIQFNGSAGTLIINKNVSVKSFFVTDSRYEIIGEEVVKKMKEKGIDLTLSIIKPRETHMVILKQLQCKRIGLNLKTLNVASLQEIIKLKNISHIETFSVDDTDKIEPESVFELFQNIKSLSDEKETIIVDLDIFKRICRPFQRPFTLEVDNELNFEKHFTLKDLNLCFSIPELDIKTIAGETYLSKLKRLFSGELENKTIVFSALHEINYLLNIRTADSTECPHLYCFMIANKTSVTLFSDAVFFDIFENAEIKINIKGYETFYSHFNDLITKNTDVILSSPNAYMLNSLNGNKPLSALKQTIDQKITSKIHQMMDKKNFNELKGFVESGIIHGVSLIKLFVKLQGLCKNDQQITEIQVSIILDEIFKSHPNFLMNSFESIIGSGKNGASIHHKASEDLINWDELLLIDCGMQTKTGTTDITRTLLFSDKKIKQKYIHDYTTVLRSQLNGKMVKGTEAAMKYLTQYVPRYIVNQHNIDYKHGTGHGVGFIGCVHEKTEFKEGSVFSVEPGIYVKGSHGIRIEDVVSSQFIKTKDGFSEFLGCVPLTYVPYQMSLIDKTQLTQYETEHLNAYNELVRKILRPYLNEEERVYLDANTITI